MHEAGRKVALAWFLASGCILGHLPHWWRGAPHALHRLASPQLHAGLSIMALLGPGREIILKGWQAMHHRRPDMNSLVGLGACASLAVSCVAAGVPSLHWPTFFEEPAMLLGCVLLGRALEERAKLAATSDLAALQGLVPGKARLEVNGRGAGYRDVPTEALCAGDILVVLPGDKLPVDGIVVSGHSSCNEAALTGEPMPATKTTGSEVTAGTVNVEGQLRVRVCKAGASTTMADILRLIESAQSRSAPVQRLADTVAGRFAVGVMGCSLATLAFWSLAGPRLFPQAIAKYCTALGTGKAGGLLLSLQLACNVLTVACPCALGLAAPTAVLVATSAAARRGLLIRGGDVLEEASRIGAVVFDKTGTLTEGRPAVQSIVPVPSRASTELLAYAAALERESSHPLAKAIMTAAEAEGCESLQMEADSCRQLPGCGISGRVQGVSVAVGSQEYVCGELDDRERAAADRFLEASTSQAAGTMQMCISLDGKLEGIFTLTDQLRADAAATVAHLQKAGYAVHMLSGDVQPVAERVAKAVGIPWGNIHAGVKPGGKAALIQKLQSQGHKVAMVGDGINDAAALAAADVGLAMGGGVDAASEVANMVLLGDRLPQVSEALQIGRRTFSKIQQNLCWAFAYNLIGVPVAAGALLPAWGLALTPSISGALMGISSLAVMANSLTLQVQPPIVLPEPAVDEYSKPIDVQSSSQLVFARGSTAQRYAQKTLL